MTFRTNKDLEKFLLSKRYIEVLPIINISKKEVIYIKELVSKYAFLDRTYCAIPFISYIGPYESYTHKIVRYKDYES